MYVGDRPGNVVEAYNARLAEEYPPERVDGLLGEAPGGPARAGSPGPMALNRAMRRRMKASLRKANRRLLKAAYRELKTLRHAEGERMFQTNAIEQALVEGDE